MIQTKKSLNFSILPVKIYIHLKCYIVGLEIEAAIQKDANGEFLIANELSLATY